MGLKPDKTNAGYSPERNTPATNNPTTHNQKLLSPNNENESCWPESLLKPGIASNTINKASTNAIPFNTADSERNCITSCLLCEPIVLRMPTSFALLTALAVARLI